MIHFRWWEIFAELEPIFIGAAMRGRSFFQRGKPPEERSSLHRARDFAGPDVRYSCSKGRNDPVCEVDRLPVRGPVMAHEIAKLLLEKAGTFLQRTQAIEAALQLGMPLNEIEEYLDWLDAVRGPVPPNSGDSPSADRPQQ